MIVNEGIIAKLILRFYFRLLNKQLNCSKNKRASRQTYIVTATLNTKPESEIKIYSITFSVSVANIKFVVVMLWSFMSCMGFEDKIDSFLTNSQFLLVYLHLNLSSVKVLENTLVLWYNKNTKLSV